MQSHYEWPADAGPALTGAVAVVGGTTRAGMTATAALGGGAVPQGTAGGLRAAASALHLRMSEALRRGDWTAFGAAFEALGLKCFYAEVSRRPGSGP